MTRTNLKDMAVLIEKSPRTEAFFIVADAIKDGLIRPAEVMGYVRKFFPKGEDGTFPKGLFLWALSWLPSDETTRKEHRRGALYRSGFTRRGTTVRESF